MDILGISVPGYGDIWESGPATYSGHVRSYGGDTIVRVVDLPSRRAVAEALRDGLTAWRNGEEVGRGDD